MNKEFEWRYDDIDIQKFRQKLKDVGAELVKPKTIMPLMVFRHPYNKKDSYIRIRNEGDVITLTSKKNLRKTFVTEYEVVINDFLEGVKILTSLGCKKKYYIEKLRETWKLPRTKEIVIDSYPGLKEYVEIECETKEDLEQVATLLGLKEPKMPMPYVNNMYFKQYGIRKKRNLTHILTFKNAHKIFKKHIKKNRQTFREILEEQQKFY